LPKGSLTALSFQFYRAFNPSILYYRNTQDLLLTSTHYYNKEAAKVIKEVDEAKMTSKHQTILPTILATILIIAVYAANAQLTNTAKIHNTGQISVNKIWAKSGSAEDIQAAVDAVAAAGGGIVYVPAGNFFFNSERTTYNGRRVGVAIPGGVSVIGAGKDVTILTSLQPTYTHSAMFFCDGSNDRPIRISGITFVGYVAGDIDDGTYPYVGYGVYMWCCKKFRVDHCKFLNFPDAGVGCQVYSEASKGENGVYQFYWNWGLIDHCDFDNPYKDERSGTWYWGYGVNVGGPGGPYAWLYNLSDILGRWDIETNPVRCALYQWNSSEQRYYLVDPYGGKYFRWLVYIEDCNFTRTRHATTSYGSAFYVVRYCTFTEPRPKGYPMSDVHGSLQVGGMGGRGLESYDNVYYAAQGYAYSCAFGMRGGGGVIFNNTIYNCREGVGLSKDQDTTPDFLVNDLWIWGNNFVNVTYPISDPQNLYTEGEDYRLQARPNYVPYPYPHPLALP
jgi:hypothetical protein